MNIDYCNYMLKIIDTIDDGLLDTFDARSVIFKEVYRGIDSVSSEFFSIVSQHIQKSLN